VASFWRGYRTLVELMAAIRIQADIRARAGLDESARLKGMKASNNQLAIVNSSHQLFRSN